MGSWAQYLGLPCGERVFPSKKLEHRFWLFLSKGAFCDVFPQDMKMFVNSFFLKLVSSATSASSLLGPNPHSVPEWTPSIHLTSHPPAMSWLFIPTHAMYSIIISWSQLWLCLFFSLSIHTLFRAFLADSLKNYWFEKNKTIKIIDWKMTLCTYRIQGIEPVQVVIQGTGSSLLAKWMSPSKTRISERISGQKNSGSSLGFQEEKKKSKTICKLMCCIEDPQWKVSHWAWHTYTRHTHKCCVARKWFLSPPR